MYVYVLLSHNCSKIQCAGYLEGDEAAPPGVFLLQKNGERSVTADCCGNRRARSATWTASTQSIKKSARIAEATDDVIPFLQMWVKDSSRHAAPLEPHMKNLSQKDKGVAERTDLIFLSVQNVLGRQLMACRVTGSCSANPLDQDSDTLQNSDWMPYFWVFPQTPSEWCV